MTDERLRELEQRWKASGSPEDEAAYLLERVRTGDLEKEKLELAAYCGHEVARLALGAEAPEVPEDLTLLFSGLRPWGRGACVAAALALARLAQSPARGDSTVLAAIAAAEEWLACPCTEHHMEARRTYGPAYEAGFEGSEAEKPLAFSAAASAGLVWDENPYEFPATALTAVERLGEATALRGVREALACWALTGNRPQA